MASYLISAQCLLDIAKKINTPAERWLEGIEGKGVATGDILISAVGPLIVERHIEALAKAIDEDADPMAPARRRDLATIKENLTRFLDDACDSPHERVAAMGLEAAACWRWLYEREVRRFAKGADGRLLTTVEKAEIAIALAGRNGHPHVYVTPACTFDPPIERLRTEDPSSIYAL